MVLVTVAVQAKLFLSQVSGIGLYLHLPYLKSSEDVV